MKFGALKWTRPVTVGLALIVQGCGGFNTRKPEPPNNEPAIPFESPSSESVVLLNIETTMRGRGSTNYQRSLAPDFAYEPPLTDGGLARLPRPWLLSNETALWSDVMDEARSQNMEIKWTWGSRQTLLSVEGETNKKYYDDLEYSCFFVRGDTSRYSGKVDLYLVDNNGLYSVYKWVDIEDDTGNRTLGWLRLDGRAFPTAQPAAGRILEP